MMDWKLFWRLFKKTKQLDNGCIEWMGDKDARGNVPIPTIAGRTNVRRLVWKELVGPIATNEVIRSTVCSNPLCLNIEHFRPIRNEEYFHRTDEELKEVFYSKTQLDEATGCLIWVGPVSLEYGKFWLNGTLVIAHRAIYELEHGKVSAEEVVRHLCHNKLCVNIEHLAIGTKQQNAIDSVRTGNSTAKLTVQDVLDVVEMLKNAIPIPDIASKYDICETAIYAIKSGRTWSHITGITPKAKEDRPLEYYREFLYSRTRQDGEHLLWTGNISKRGYGKVEINGKCSSAHRFLYELEKGAIADGFVVRHLCNRKDCVNVDHLTIGTSKDNAGDTLRDGANTFAKLTPDQVRDIRIRLANGATTAELMELFSISDRSIRRIARNETWIHIT